MKQHILPEGVKQQIYLIQGHREMFDIIQSLLDGPIRPISKKRKTLPLSLLRFPPTPGRRGLR